MPDGNKVSADWLVTWVGGPHTYNPKSKMPDLRLEEDQAADIAAYLIQFGKKEINSGQ